nr:retrovirus-related Pol polyprotein from transposon TNT 1-94 [Tanacetum cinerariifolium]
LLLEVAENKIALSIALNNEKHNSCYNNDFLHRFSISFIEDVRDSNKVIIKDEAIDKFVLYKTEVENQLGKKIKVVRSDRGGEYVSPFAELCAKHKIRHEFTAPYSPQQNGIAERKNRTLKEMVTAMLISFGMSQDMWGEAILMATYLLNKIPRKDKEETPYELWMGRKPSYQYLRVWGCLAKVAVPAPKAQKIGPNSIDCIFIGYAKNSKTGSSSRLDDEVVQDKRQQDDNDLQDERQDQTAKEEVELKRSKRARNKKSFGPDFVSFMVENEPTSYREAVTSSEGQQWREAIKSYKWIFKKNMKADGTIDKYKARLVIKGFRQREGLDYFDTYSPVTRITSIRMIVAIAALRNLEIHQMDMKTAFLNGDLEEEKYMNQPEDFIAPGQEGKVCRLVKSLYGLTQAPKQWHQKFDHTMLESGFKINECDKCVYVKDTSSGYIILCLYVDDMLIVGSNDKMIKSTKDMLKSKFDMKDMGLAVVILGIKIIRTQNGLLLSQAHYVDKILNTHNAEDSGQARTPIDTGTRPDLAYAISRLRGAAISWKSSKQTVIDKSTMKSEFIALDKCSEEAEWLRQFVEDIPMWPKPVTAISIHCDSKSAMGRAKSTMYNEKSRHIRRRHNSIRQLLSTGVISIDYVASKDNIGSLMEPSGSEASKTQSKYKGNVPIIDVDSENVNQSVDEHVSDHVDEETKSIVEDVGFSELVWELNSEFELPSRWAVARDAFSIYQEEAQKLENLLKNQTVCLTTDTWTSVQNYYYMCLTAHWVDDSCKLRKKILNFCRISNHKGVTIENLVYRCLQEWGLICVFTVTVDNASSNDGAIRKLRTLLKGPNAILDCKYLHLRCCAYIINLVVGDGLEEQNSSICKIRRAVKYLISSSGRQESFENGVQFEKVDCKRKPCLDVDTRWNFTFLMLETAVKFEKVFDRLELTEHDYTSYFFNEPEDGEEGTRMMPKTKKKKKNVVGVPNEDDWSNARKIVLSIKAKYDKYWDNLDNMNVLLYVALVLDPQNKLKYLEFCLDLIYPKSRTETSNQGDQVSKRLKTLSAKTIEICKIVKDALQELYVHYKIKLDKYNDETFTVSSSSTPSEDDCSMKIDLDDGFSKYLETQYGEEHILSLVDLEHKRKAPAVENPELVGV